MLVIIKLLMNWLLKKKLRKNTLYNTSVFQPWGRDLTWGRFGIQVMLPEMSSNLSNIII